MRWVAGIAIALVFALLAPSPALAAPPPYYPPIEYIPAARSNYDAGRSAPIRAIVIHETAGTWLSATNWFRNPNSHVSSHYLVRADRKSTRLNSSHLVISYAVFCLNNNNTPVTS